MMVDERGAMSEVAGRYFHSSLITAAFIICFSSSFPEELLHERAALRVEHARRQFHPVIQRTRVADAEDRLDRARLLIPRAVNEALDSRLHERAGAHRTRLNR